MRDDMCRTEPLGIEWEFANGDLALVAHIPSEGNAFICARIDEPGSHEEMTPKARAFTRTLLAEALRLLDATEPTNKMTGVRA